METRLIDFRPRVFNAPVRGRSTRGRGEHPNRFGVRRSAMLIGTLGAGAEIRSPSASVYAYGLDPQQRDRRPPASPATREL
jgi:hypothetical protein